MIRIQTKDTIFSIHCWVRLRWWWPWVWSCHQPAGTRPHNIRWADPIEQPQHKIWAETPAAIEQGKRVDSPSSVNPSHFQMYGIDGRFFNDFPHTWTLSLETGKDCRTITAGAAKVHSPQIFHIFQRPCLIKLITSIVTPCLPNSQKLQTGQCPIFGDLSWWSSHRGEQRRLVTPGHCMPFNMIGPSETCTNSHHWSLPPIFDGFFSKHDTEIPPDLSKGNHEWNRNFHLPTGRSQHQLISKSSFSQVTDGRSPLSKGGPGPADALPAIATIHIRRYQTVWEALTWIIYNIMQIVKLYIYI